MRSGMLMLAGAMALGAAASAQAPPKTHLKVGDEAPGFTLPSSTGKFSLADYRGKQTVVVAFFPAAFTGG